MGVRAYKFRAELAYARPSKTARLGLGGSRLGHLSQVQIYCASTISEGGQVGNTECTSTEANDLRLLVYSVLGHVA